MAQKKSKTYLLSIRQESGETLRQYLAHFTEESQKVEGVDGNDAITAITEGARTSDFLKSIVGWVLRDMAKLMTRTRTYMGIELYLDGQKGSGQGNRRQDDRDEDRHEPRKMRHNGGLTPNGHSLPGQRQPRADSFRKFSAFTPLNTPPERILALHRDKLGTIKITRI